jgi:hypothetical protein
MERGMKIKDENDKSSLTLLYERREFEAKEGRCIHFPLL